MERQETIMLVDDTPANLKLLQEMLQAEDRLVLTFPRGALALKAAARNPPDLILLDIMMPEMDGYEVIRQLKADPETADIPVIFLTAKAEVEDEQKGFQLGAVDYITKPISPPIVLARVKTHLALKNARDLLKEKNESLEREIIERKRAEEKIKALLEEKVLLLQEVHHRIKNNISTAMSLLDLHAVRLEDPKAIAALRDSKSRLGSMSLLYDKLYRTENLRAMSIKDYLPALVDEVIGVFPNKASVKIETRIDDFSLGGKVLSSLGIIVNELLTNTMKHAFIDKDDGLLTVSATANDNLATVIIEDNGIGIPESFDIQTSTGFGLRLVGMLTRQIRGTIRVERETGTRFILQFGISN